MELVLPNNHVELEQDEMMYLDGGASIRTTATNARNAFNVMSSAGTVLAATAGAAAIATTIVSRIVGAIVGAIFGWWANFRSHASTAYHQAVQLVASRGGNSAVWMNISTNMVGWVTGMSTIRA